MAAAGGGLLMAVTGGLAVWARETLVTDAVSECFWWAWRSNNPEGLIDDGSEPLNGLPMWLCWGPAGCASAGCRGAHWYHIGSKCKKRAKTGEDILGMTWCVRNRLKWSIPAKLCTCHRGNMVTNEGISGYKPKYLDYLVISCDILCLVQMCSQALQEWHELKWWDVDDFFQAVAVGTPAAVGAAVGPLASGWEPNSPRWGSIPKMGEKFVLNRLKSTCTLFSLFSFRWHSSSVWSAWPVAESHVLRQVWRKQGCWLVVWALRTMPMPRFKGDQFTRGLQKRSEKVTLDVKIERKLCKNHSDLESTQ